MVVGAGWVSGWGVRGGGGGRGGGWWVGREMGEENKQLNHCGRNGMRYSLTSSGDITATVANGSIKRGGGRACQHPVKCKFRGGK